MSSKDLCWRCLQPTIGNELECESCMQPQGRNADVITRQGEEIASLKREVAQLKDDVYVLTSLVRQQNE